LCGVLCVVCVAVIWTFGTVATKYIYEEFDFHEPLVFTYLTHAIYAVQLPLFALGRLLGLVPDVPWRAAEEEQPRKARRPLRCSVAGHELMAGSRELGAEPGPEPGPEPGLEAMAGARELATADPSVREAVIAGCVISPFLFVGQWLFKAGIGKCKTYGTVTMISTTSSVWMFLASVAFLGERVTKLKVLGVLLCLGGGVMRCIWDSEEAGSGLIYLLGSALFYAGYTTLLSKMAHEDVSVALLFGTIGVCIALFGIPVLLLFSFSALQGMTWKVVLCSIGTGLVDNVLSQFLWAKAVQWTSPNVATIGLCLQVPFNLLADALHGRCPTYDMYAAGAMVAAGFVAISHAGRPEADADADAA